VKKIMIPAVLLSIAALVLVGQLAPAAEVALKVVLENARVEVTERIMEPGVVRETHIRPTDQVIVFLNDAEYERIDPDTGEKTVRKRKAGDVIWHSRGEVAPTLTNVAKTPLRSLEIALKGAY
jgi:hypothetical protein